MKEYWVKEVKEEKVQKQDKVSIFGYNLVDPKITTYFETRNQYPHELLIDVNIDLENYKIINIESRYKVNYYRDGNYYAGEVKEEIFRGFRVFYTHK